MLSSPEPAGPESRLLNEGKEQSRRRKTIQLPGISSPSTAPLPAQPSLTPLTDTRMPVYIPGTSKRRTDPLPEMTPHKRRVALPGIVIGSILAILLASSFVVPLDSSQHPLTIAQIIGHVFSVAPDSGVNTPLHAPTQTPAIASGEGSTSCRGTDIWSTCATFITASGLQGTGQMQHPIQGAVISQYFGHPEYQLWCGCWKPHTGIDLAAPYGTPIMAADTGQVIWVGWDWSGLGWAVKINHGNYIATIYGHMDHYIVRVGQNVTKGQVIGYEGSTGASTGPHVHFMVLVHNVWVDPQLYVALP